MIESLSKCALLHLNHKHSMKLAWKKKCANKVTAIANVLRSSARCLCVLEHVYMGEVCFAFEHSDHVLKRTDMQSHSPTSSAFLAACEFQTLKVFEWSVSDANLCLPTRSFTREKSDPWVVSFSLKLSVVILWSQRGFKVSRRIFWEFRV